MGPSGGIKLVNSQGPEQTDPSGATNQAPAPAGGTWLSRNGPFMLALIAGFTFLMVRFGQEEILRYLLVALGLGLVIFIHELGHFLVAKWCDVHVKTFSIGFPPTLPGCTFKWGETTYTIGMIPLGGYVNMVGEGPETDENDNDPRSFKNKSVLQRMAIISAGVVMNLLLAFACFVFVFRTHGDEQIPGVIGTIDSGSPLWKTRARSGDVIEWIDGRGPYPSLDQDLMVVVMNSKAGQALRLVFGPPNAKEGEWVQTEVVPRKEKGDKKAMIGIGFPKQLKLRDKQIFDSPTIKNSPASRATPEFEFQDEILATSDHEHPDQVTELPADPRNPEHRDYFAFDRRLRGLAGKDMIVQVRRHESQEIVSIQVPPAFHYNLGMRMRMGKITAVRDHGPAAEQGVLPQDIIEQVIAIDGHGEMHRFGNFRSKETGAASTQELDPLRLPFELHELAKKAGGIKTVELVLLRKNPLPDAAGQASHREDDRGRLKLNWDDSWRFNDEEPLSLASPLSIPELGLAYGVDTTIAAVQEGSPASHARIEKTATIKVKKDDVMRDAEGQQVEAKEGDTVTLEEGWTINLKEGDVVQAARFMKLDKDGQTKPDEWLNVPPDHFARVDEVLQNLAEVKAVGLRLERDQLEVTITGLEQDHSWPLVERGWLFREDSRLKKADNLGEALLLGVDKTRNFLDQILGSLRALVTRRVDPDNFGGPVTIVRVAYLISGENIYRFIVFLGIIGVNLVVMNFLPIPVLDGGHMVFLLWELVRGKPAPDRVRVAATYIGFLIIIGLMVGVFYLDLKKIFIG
jgi:regulator of sigma E protease